jgi:hypothetical protein
MLHYPTPETDAEAAVLVTEIEQAIERLQLGEAERMLYELVRFHWRHYASRLEGAYAALDAMATHNFGASLAECERLRLQFAGATTRLVA